MSKTKDLVLDVRPRLARGEEPFAVIHTAVVALVAGQALTIVAPFLPAPLIERLKGEGFAAQVEHREDSEWAVTFRRVGARDPKES
jgi:uncharacterized protein (DUF2249 family)